MHNGGAFSRLELCLPLGPAPFPDLELFNPRNEVRAVMELSKLFAVFDVGDDEAVAVRSFATLQHTAS